jgi:8-oxo-dGTP pyrophosphatase MutT (NUDIX family)
MNIILGYKDNECCAMERWPGEGPAREAIADGVGGGHTQPDGRTRQSYCLDISQSDACHCRLLPLSASAEQFVATFVYYSKTNTCVLIKEFAQAALPQTTLVYNLPGGGFLPKRHASLQHAAQDELSEEAGLKGGTWVRLLPDGNHPGVLETKWCRNRLTPFLCIDPDVDPTPRPQEAFEYIQRTEVTLPELRAAMLGGEMLLPALYTCMAALDRLERDGRIAPDGSSRVGPRRNVMLAATAAAALVAVAAVGVVTMRMSKR